MKRIVLIFSIIIISVIEFVSFAQMRNLSNPMYLSILLIDQPTLSGMRTTCEYYNLTELPLQDNYVSYSHPDGTEIRFKVDELVGRNYPEVQVVTGKDLKAIEKMLTEAGYVKTDDGYVKGSKFEHRRTRCRISGATQKTLTLTKEYRTQE